MTRSQQIIINRIADIDDPVFLNKIAAMLARYDTEKVYLSTINSKSGRLYYEVSAKLNGLKRIIGKSVNKDKAVKIKAHYELHGNIKI